MPVVDDCFLVLRGQVDVLPDNKCVEDMHSLLKLDSKAKANREMRAAISEDCRFTSYQQMLDSVAQCGEKAMRGVDGPEVDGELNMGCWCIVDDNAGAVRRQLSNPSHGPLSDGEEDTWEEIFDQVWEKQQMEREI